MANALELQLRSVTDSFGFLNISEFVPVPEVFLDLFNEKIQVFSQMNEWHTDRLPEVCPQTSTFQKPQQLKGWFSEFRGCLLTE